MRISVSNKDGIALIKISGNMILDETLFLLRDEVKNGLESGLQRFIVDLAEVPHIDSSGCGEIIRIYSSIVKAQGTVTFVSLTDRVRLLWNRIRLTDVFHIFETTDEAQTFLLKTFGTAGA
jgi:anti-sigma B factor antagonist